MSHSQWSRPTHTRLAALLDGRELTKELVQGARHNVDAAHPGGLAEEKECEQHLILGGLVVPAAEVSRYHTARGDCA